MTVYPEFVRSLLNTCANYRKKMIDINTLKAAVWEAASKIVHVDERELRNFLQHAEGRLDMIQFTVDDDKVFDRSLEIVDQIEMELKRALEA